MIRRGLFAESRVRGVRVDGTSTPLPLATPSAQTSGLKFNIHANLVEGVEYKLWIDFDAARSVVVTGNTDYKLKPVLRTFTEATSGAIKGNVQPAAALATVFAIAGTDSLSAIPDAVTGSYLIRGVPAGSWKTLADGNNGYADQTINNYKCYAWAGNLGRYYYFSSLTKLSNIVKAFRPA